LGKLAPAINPEAPAPTEDDTRPSTFTSVVRRVFGGGDGSALKVTGHDDLLVYRAKCCNPIRGEEIVGYVTRGKGVAVHSRNCPNVHNLLYEPERRIAVEWARDAHRTPGEGGYPVKITVFCDDRPGMLKQITAIISDANTNIRNIEARTGDLAATVDVIIDIEDLKHLERMTTGIRKIPGVRDVQRVQKL
jgi:GTP pyrophosphokinase